MFLCETETNKEGNDSTEGHLISPFNGLPKGPVHPYITVCNKRPDLTPVLIDEIRYLLHHPDPR